MYPRNGRGLVFFPLPIQGHLSPMLQLAQILHSRGFSVTVIHTQFNSPEHSKYPHFSFLPILDDGVSNGKHSASGISNAVHLLPLLNQTLPGPFSDCLARAMADGESKGAPVACLITDPHWHFARSITDGLKLPRLVLRPNGFGASHVFNSFPVLREKGYFSLSERDALSTAEVPGIPPLRFKDIPKSITTDPESLAEVLGAMIEETKASLAIIWNTSKDLEEAALERVYQYFPNRSFPIGPFHEYFPASSSSLLVQDRTVISWLDEQAPKSVLYVSFGSILRLEQSSFLEMAHGLANSKQPFLWVVRPGSVIDSEWIEALPTELAGELKERGRIVKWSPQQEVLAHPATGGFLSHCGWNSTVESICEGVPMLCSPFFTDQPTNARYVTDVWRVGVMLENGLERGEIERAIKRLMVGRESEEIRERMMGLKAKVNLSVKKGGSSYESLEGLVQYILSL